MKIIIAKNYSELSKRAAEIVIGEMQRKPDLVLGFCTGATPLGLYRELVKAEKERGISFSRVTTFNLDEYYPIKKTDKNSFYYFMFKNLFGKVKIRKNKINILNGEAKNPKKECQLYRKKLQKNKIDLQILGIGANGHIAFNEPGSSFKSKTRLVNFAGQKALTMGIAEIMGAKKIILLASGIKKARAVKRMIEGTINPFCPASILQKHPNAIIILDEEAASLIKEEETLYEIEKETYQVLTEENMPKKKKIVIISPHPDDVAINCGGSLTLLRKFNKITALIMTTGYRSQIPKKTKKEIIKIREKEAIGESKILGFTPYFLRLSFYDKYHGDIEKKDIKKIIKKLKQIKPDILLIPHKNDKHPIHRLSRKIILKCLKKMRRKVDLWNYETMWSLFSPEEFNLIVSFSEEFLKLKIKAIKQHKSQIARTPFEVAAYSLAKFRGAIVPEQELFGFGEKSTLKDKNIELFFVEK